MGGDLQGKLYVDTEEQRIAVTEAGYDLDAVMGLDDLIRGENCFFAATGITTGDLLKGVNYTAEGITTTSLVMRGRSGTVRVVEAHHKPEKLRAMDALGFE